MERLLLQSMVLPSCVTVHFCYTQSGVLSVVDTKGGLGPCFVNAGAVVSKPVTCPTLKGTPQSIEAVYTSHVPNVWVGTDLSSYATVVEMHT